MECQSRIIEEKCGCVVYYMPRLSRHARICGRSDVACYHGVISGIERGERESETCFCLSACFELGFMGLASSAPIIANRIRMDNNSLKLFPRAYIQ